jgi:hypothetical protein
VGQSEAEGEKGMAHEVISVFYEQKIMSLLNEFERMKDLSMYLSRTRHKAWQELLKQGKPAPPPTHETVVTLHRVGGVEFDDDNLRMSLKGIRDGVARFLGRPDKQCATLRWRYAWTPSAAKEHMFYIKIESRPYEAQSSTLRKRRCKRPTFSAASGLCRAPKFDRCEMG